MFCIFRDLESDVEVIPMDSDYLYEPETEQTETDYSYEATPHKVKLFDDAANKSAITVTKSQDTATYGPIHHVYECCLRELLQLQVPSTCPKPTCKLKLDVHFEIRGTASYLTWVCLLFTCFVHLMIYMYLIHGDYFEFLFLSLCRFAPITMHTPHGFLSPSSHMASTSVMCRWLQAS